jgi:hypothetical protein
MEFHLFRFVLWECAAGNRGGKSSNERDGCLIACDCTIFSATDSPLADRRALP